MFDALKKWKAPAERLAFLETTLAPQIADAERALQTRKAAERAAVIRSRIDDIATRDAELAKLSENLAKTAKVLDAASRAMRTAEATHLEAYFALRSAHHLRDVTNGRYERALAPLGGDTIATTIYRLTWLSRVAADYLGRLLPPEMIKGRQKQVDFSGLDWVPSKLAEVTARALSAVEALALAPVSVEEIEAACEDALTRCYAVAGETIMRSAPWGTMTTHAAMH